MKRKYHIACISALVVANAIVAVACGDDDVATATGGTDAGQDVAKIDATVPDAAKPKADAAGALTINLRANYLNCPTSPIECGPGLQKGTFRSSLWKTFPPPDGGTPVSTAATPDASFPLTQVITSPSADTYTIFSYLDVAPESPMGPGDEDLIGAPQAVHTSNSAPVEANVALRDPPPKADAGDGGNDADADGS